ncbi:MAG TPA: SDR family NAD(P)-dependent oxidoreductase [Acidimicrobiales bacterium]|nr:SDR family NAD(P)-dependent oxidoreductase [Acidimicrobiales bacterium]
MEPGGVALVTGAGRGLGRAVALELARRGFDVVAGARDTSVVLPSDGPGRITVERLDVTDLGTFTPPEGLRVLVNNAGYRGPYLAIEGTGLDEWRRTFETNLFGVAELTRRCLPALRATRGVVCNVASTGAFFPSPFYSVYRASKAALGVLNETLAIEVAPFGVRVIEITTGPVDTDMMRTSFSVRPADAIDDPMYAPMAERQWANRVTIEPTPVDEEARGVVDQILTDDGPLRRPAVALEAEMVERWRATTDEERLGAIRRAFGL